jgi:3-(3-hydroxy-phenyl)propionate hydroxylase
MKRRHDRIIVAGGGSVGAFAALLLARAGIPVVVLERDTQLYTDYRASTWHPPTLELLEESGATAELISKGLILPLMHYRDREQGLIAVFDLEVLHKDTRHPYRVHCEQFKFTRWCHEQLTKIPGAEWHFSSNVTAVKQLSDGSIEVTATTPNGPQIHYGDFLIGADGGRSAVRKLLDIEFEGFHYPAHFLVAGTPYDFKSAIPGVGSVNYTADPVEWFLLMEIPDMWRVILPVSADLSPDEALKEERIQSALKNIAPRDVDYELLNKNVYRVGQRVAATYRKGNAFLAGDAAHINNPIGGVGLNGGVQDAISLTRRLIRVWHGKADQSILEQYEVQQKPIAVDAIHAITHRNKQTLEERDPEVRARGLARWRSIAADPALARQYLLESSMINAVQKSGLLTESA